jgi:type IV pilus assembly protein PilO
MANTAKVLIIFALVALVFVGYFFLSYRVKQNEIDQADKEIASLQNQLNEVKAVAEVLQPIQHEIETLDQQLKQSLAQLPEDKQIEGLLRSFEDLGSSSGLEIQRFTPTAEVAKDFYAEIPITVQIKGGYHNIAIFFDKISKLKRVINISDLKLSNAAEVNGEMQVTASCTATTFRFRRAGEILAAEAAAREKAKSAPGAKQPAKVEEPPAGKGKEKEKVKLD